MFERREDSQNILEDKAAETIVGTSVRLKGNLRSDGNITIDGHVSGDIKTKASVFVGAHATILANITAGNIEVSGNVQGNLEAHNRLEITETGRVHGDINTTSLSVSPGALFIGKCTMQEKEGRQHIIKEETSEEYEPLIELEAETGKIIKNKKK